MDDRLSEACQELCQGLREGLTKIDRSISEFASAYLKFVAGVLADADWSTIIKPIAALNAAPPRVRHLAKYSRKGRVRKKNLHRALHKH